MKVCCDFCIIKYIPHCWYLTQLITVPEKLSSMIFRTPHRPRIPLLTMASPLQAPLLLLSYFPDSVVTSLSPYAFFLSILLSPCSLLSSLIAWNVICIMSAVEFYSTVVISLMSPVTSPFRYGKVNVFKADFLSALFLLCKTVLIVVFITVKGNFIFQGAQSKTLYITVFLIHLFLPQPHRWWCNSSAYSIRLFMNAWNTVSDR